MDVTPLLPEIPCGTLRDDLKLRSMSSKVYNRGSVKIKTNRRPDALSLFLLGHMCWGYIIGKATSSAFHVKVNPYLLLFLGAIPDVDLLLGIFGIQHRTWTHSILIWSLIFVPLFIKYRAAGAPYYASIIQHIAFGDSITGSITPFWPISNVDLGLGYNLLSIQNMMLEAAGVALFFVVALRNKNERIFLFEKRKGAALAILPIIPLLGFILFAYFYGLTNGFAEHDLFKSGKLLYSTPAIIANRLFPIEVVMHVVVTTFLSASLFCKLRRAKETPSNIERGT